MNITLRPQPLRLSLGLSLLLAACTGTAPNRPIVQAPITVPTVPAVIDHVTVQPPASIAMPLQGNDVWNRLRSSFVMPDCDADPAILTWAKYYTHNPQRFETQMRAAMPQLLYVQQIAAKHGVAGEFALLPWVESQYQPAVGHKNSPSGMWQIMPITAHSMGLRVDGGYDGRLDVPASADAVMTLLRRYHDDMKDWRLTDYAYNAGEFGVHNLVDRHGPPPAEPAIPRLPVKAVTREHLAKLLAVACVVREPSRFNVSLPLLSTDQQLEVVNVDRTMPITQAANHAGMSVDALMNLNAAYRNGRVDPQASSLLLPHSNAEQFRNAVMNPNQADNLLLANVTPKTRLPALPSEDDDSDRSHRGNTSRSTDLDNRATTPVKTHTVGRKDSLWGIARQYSVSVKQLQQWNHLQGQQLKPGQRLKVSSPG